jgi:hypothetical protein
MIAATNPDDSVIGIAITKRCCNPVTFRGLLRCKENGPCHGSPTEEEVELIEKMYARVDNAPAK